MQVRKAFLVIFIVAGFVMKIVAEFVHEVCGHGSIVLLFGGEIKGVHISVLWPYELSYINWNLPSSVNSAQMVWVYAGGILVCLCVSFLAQALLLLKNKISWHFALTLFLLAFWTFVNSTGYLIIGGLIQFGDVGELIKLGILTNFFFLIVGLIISLIGFVALSWILRKILIKLFPLKKASLGVSLFWLTIPVLAVVMVASPERNLQMVYIPLAFIPASLSFVIEYFLFLSKQEADANPNDIAKE